MADTAIPLTELSAGGAAVAEPAGTAIVAANTHTITLPRDVTPEEVVVRIKHTTASEKDVTVTAGDAPPNLDGEPADIVAVMGAGDSTPTVKYVQLSSAQVQDDGTVVITVESGTTGTLAALHCARV